MQKLLQNITRFNSGLIAIIFGLLSICLFQSARYTAHMAYHISPDYLPIWFHICLVLTLLSLMFLVVFTMIAICWTPKNNVAVVEEKEKYY